MPQPSPHFSPDPASARRSALPAMYIHGLGLAGGFGTGPAQFQETLEGSRPPRIAMVNATGPASQPQVELPLYQADISSLDTFLPKRALLRVDRFSRMALLGACLALEDASLTPGLAGPPMDRTGIVIATGYGPAATSFAFLDSVIQDGDTCASPTHFSNSVHNAAAAHISILLNITGPSLTVTQFESSVASALLSAGQWLAEGRVNRVLFGAVEEYCPVRGYGWSRLFGPATAQPMAPLECDRQTAIMGEGAAFFVLGRADAGPGAYARIVDVRTGRHSPSHAHPHEETLSASDLLILGADGHRACGRGYALFLERTPLAAVCSPAYGSLPVGQAFDLALAALISRKRRLVPGMTLSGSVPNSGPGADISRVTCLKLGTGGEYAVISVHSV